MKVIIIITISIVSSFVYGQGYFNNWYFGNGAGLDFNTGSPLSINGNVHTTEGCASISDYSGNLLFYTDGITVWDATHAVMANGTGLSGNVSSTQSALIVPHPGNANQFYLFTTQPSGAACYSIIDMTLGNGLGAVTSTKNNVLHFNSTERMTAVCLEDESGYWIIGHEAENKVFFAYELTAGGLSATPVLSSIGSAHIGQGNYIGNLKPSHSGNKLAIAIRYLNSFEVFDFSTTSGMLSNAITFPSAYLFSYGVEFSPDDSRLYLSGGIGSPYIYQVNMNAGNNAAIINSSVLIANPVVNGGMGSLQTGPDSKVYASKYGSNTLGVINAPNAFGALSNYVDTQIVLTPATTRFGLPNNYKICCSLPVVSLGADTTICAGQSITLNAGSAAAYLWSNGSTAQSINVSSSGIYWVQTGSGQCTARDSLTIDLASCDIEIAMPNVFTPNNDGFNDHFIPVKYKGITKASLKIFNRWGEELFNTNNLLKGWNGFHKENSCTDGAYFWLVNYTTITNQSQELKGFLTLLK